MTLSSSSGVVSFFKKGINRYQPKINTKIGLEYNQATWEYRKVVKGCDGGPAAIRRYENTSSWQVEVERRAATKEMKRSAKKSYNDQPSYLTYENVCKEKRDENNREIIIRFLVQVEWSLSASLPIDWS